MLIPVFLVILIFVFSAMPYQAGGFLNVESTFFLRNYLDDRGFFQKIFDPAKNDWGLYQGRELSYFFDWLDANLILLSVKLDIPMFFQTSHFIGIALIACLHVYFCRKYIKGIDLPTLSLLSLLFTISPIAYFSGNYFRSSKILTATLLFFTIWSWYLYLQKSKTALNRSIKHVFKGSFFWLSLAMALVDRQGFYFAISLSFLVVIHCLLNSEKIDRYLVASFIVAAIAGSFYNLLIGPVLIRLINGYWPDFSYQKLNLDPVVFKHYWLSLNLAIDHFRFFIGTLWKPFSVLTAFILWGTFLIPSKKREGVRPKLFRFIFVFVVFALICTMYSIMRLKHDAIGWPYLRRIYYWIPTHVVILFFLTFIVQRLNAIHRFFRIFNLAVLAAALGSSIYMIKEHDVVVKVGYCKNEILHGPRLRKCSISPNVPVENFDLNPDQAAVCVFLRKKISGT